MRCCAGPAPQWLHPSEAAQRRQTGQFSFKLPAASPALGVFGPSGLEGGCGVLLFCLKNESHTSCHRRGKRGHTAESRVVCAGRATATLGLEVFCTLVSLVLVLAPRGFLQSEAVLLG